MPTPNQVACAACECYPSKLILGLCPECRMKVVRPPAKYQWTADMDDQLRQIYRRTGRKKLVLSAELTKFCSAFRLPRTAVMNRARRLGMNIVRPFKPWTHEEKEGLRKLTGLLGVNTIAKRLGRSPLIWSDPVNLCTSMGLFLLLSLLLPLIEDRASRSQGRSERRLISLIFAGRNRIILIRRELPLTKVASPAVPVA